MALGCVYFSMTSFPDCQVTEHLPALLRYARSLLRDDSAAEDLVHDTLVLAYTHADQYRPERSLRTWLFSILHNRFVSDLRQRGALERRLAALAALPAEVPPSEQETRLRLSEVERSLLKLSDDQRAALHLVVCEGLSYQEAASALSIPIGTLISRISRARTRLRELDEGEIGAPATPKLRIVKD